MDITELKIYLSQNPDILIDVLEKLGYVNIKLNHNEIRCASDVGLNASACRIKLTDSLSSVDFSSSYDGSLFDVIAAHKNIEFFDAVNLVKTELGIDTSFSSSSLQHHKPFSSVFSEMSRDSSDVVSSELTIYEESELDVFEDEMNYRFYKDGISLYTQKFFNIRYDYESHRIVVPWRDEYGNIIGFMGRANYSDADNKWLPINGYAFPKNRVLYGYFHNKDYIIDKETLLIAESEKSPMQAHSMTFKKDDAIKRIRNVVALGGSTINPYQIKLIHELKVKKIILCFDEGLDIIKIEKEASKLMSKNPFMKIKIGYIYDHDHKYLPFGSKMSPFDNGINTLTGLIREKVIWLN